MYFLLKYQFKTTKNTANAYIYYEKYNAKYYVDCTETGFIRTTYLLIII